MSTRIETLNPETTTGKSKELFNAVQSKLGFIPNLIKVFGNSPATLQSIFKFRGVNRKRKLQQQIQRAISISNCRRKLL